MSGTEYPKIETLYVRDPVTRKVTEELRLPEFGLVNSWLVTEKIDGTNIRVAMEPPDVYGPSDGDLPPRLRFGGKTDNAQISTDLVSMLQDTFSLSDLIKAFPADEDGHFPHAVLYGEGYGPKINKGGGYRSAPGFRLFDVKVGNWWLNWDNVVDIAKKLGINTVPVLMRTSWDSAFFREYVHSPQSSWVAAKDTGSHVDDVRPMEGIVARTDPLLFTRKGERLMWKLKLRDF